RYPNAVNSLSYRVLHGSDYSMLKYSLKHFADFYRGLQKLSLLFAQTQLPPQMQFYIDRINKILREEPIRQLAALPPNQVLAVEQNIYFTHFLRNQYRNDSMELVDVYSRLEAWYSMAMAVKTYGLQFPEFIEGEEPLFEATGLYHLLLQQPVAYDIVMQKEQNFLFLTGANMAGKSTLIKAIGSATFLAHIGMGVPVKNMRLTLFDGLLTNINVVDNITRGESYFFNEVQRIKNTIYKINDGKKWLVLIDELFKGTNVQDAMKCSLAVIKGLIKIKNSFFILSTHLYEIAEELKPHTNISFKYFETTVLDDQLHFSYDLKEGVSNDRIGYVILRREKVVEMLEKL
ncbi:MAG: DNA mismatch repair protein MutS, partial [Chitinophagaceae bacterium]